MTEEFDKYQPLLGRKATDIDTAKAQAVLLLEMWEDDPKLEHNNLLASLVAVPYPDPHIVPWPSLKQARYVIAVCSGFESWPDLLSNLSRSGPRDINGRSELEFWKAAARQGCRDLCAIEKAFSDAEKFEDCPIGPGQVWADWSSPANTIRWVTAGFVPVEPK